MISLQEYQKLIDDLRSGGASATLTAVCKSQPATKIRTMLDYGQRIFGENKVQEALQRWSPLREEYPDLELHLIGSLQSNKVTDAVRLFDVIETVDRPKIAHAISGAAVQQSKVMRCFIQVNIGREPQKSGVSLEDLPALVMQCRALPGLALEGLMCVPPHEEAPAPYFALTRKLAQEHNLPSVSMGMSGDYKTALLFGATHVRLGTALFGQRL